MNNFKQYTEANRKAWNEAIPYHQKAMNNKWDQLFSDKDFIIQKDEELKLLKEVGIKDKNIAHLSCNNGLELMSLKKMGAAHCCGFDISDKAIEDAKTRAERYQIDCKFIRTDVLEIGEEYYNQYDFVYITVGALTWIPDKNLYFEKAANLLRKGGKIFIYEHHPFANVFPYDGEEGDTLKVVRSYFNKEVFVDHDGIDYYGGEIYEASPTYEFDYTLADLFNILASKGLMIQKFNEYSEDVSLAHQELEKTGVGLPLSYILIAEKV